DHSRPALRSPDLRTSCHLVPGLCPGDSGIIGSAVMAADTVIIPASPTGLDLNRIMPTISLLASLEPVHPVEGL
ncbi:MAG: hypothetical protein ACXVLK_19055, partial [Acidimicrobiales bacterium]